MGIIISVYILIDRTNLKQSMFRFGKLLFERRLEISWLNISAELMSLRISIFIVCLWMR